MKLNFAEIELRGTETTLRQIETRLVNVINSTMTGKSFVAVRIHSLAPLKYGVLNGPPGSTPPKQWWDFGNNFL